MSLFPSFRFGPVLGSILDPKKGVNSDPSKGPSRTCCRCFTKKQCQNAFFKTEIFCSKTWIFHVFVQNIAVFVYFVDNPKKSLTSLLSLCFSPKSQSRDCNLGQKHAKKHCFLVKNTTDFSNKIYKF